jgi:putative membrane protein
MWGTGWGYWGWGWWFWVFWAFILFLIIWGIGWGWNPRGGHGAGDEVAERVLRERYARGEISDEEFDRKLKRLRRAA